MDALARLPGDMLDVAEHPSISRLSRQVSHMNSFMQISPCKHVFIYVCTYMCNGPSRPPTPRMHGSTVTREDQRCCLKVSFCCTF